MAVAYTLGTPVALSTTAALTASQAVASGDQLVIAGITKYDTLSINTITTANPAVRITGTILEYAADGSAPVWKNIGSVDGGDGRAMTLTFVDGAIDVTDAIVNTVMRAIQFTTNTTTGTIADDRAITLKLNGTSIATDNAITVTMTATTGADKFIYSSSAVGFDPLGGDDTLIVESGVGALTLDMKTTTKLEKFENLDASSANAAITLTMGSGVKDVKLGSGVDTIKIAAAADLGTVTVNGGSGRDTLEVTADAQTLAATDLAKLSSVEILKTKDGANSVTMGATDSVNEIIGGAGVDTIDASARTVASAASGSYDLTITTAAGDDIVKGSAGNDNIDLGAGDDTLTVIGANFNANDKIAGGAGTADKIILNGTTVIDSAFTQVTGIETLEGIATTTSLTLGDKAKTAGITKVDLATTAATGAATVDMSSMTSNGGFTVLAGTGGTTVKMTATNLAAGDDTITGDSTSTADVLEVTTAGTIASGKLDTVTDMDTLKYSSTIGDFDVTLKDGSGFTTVDATAATGNVKVDASAEATAASQTINTGSGNDTILIGTVDTTVASGGGDDTITSNTGANTIGTGAGDDIVNLVAGTDAVNVGAGTDTVKVGVADFTSADTITGTGDVTLEFTDATNETDGDTSDFMMDTDTVESMFAASGNSIDTIKLGAATAQSVTLGANATAAGVTQIDGSALTGALTADLSAFATAGVTVKGGTADDVVKMISADVTSATSIQGGTGTDTLEIVDAATVLDADFTLSTSLEKLVLSKDGAHSVTVGDLAKAAGLTTIDASMDNVTDPTVPAAQTTASSITVNMTNDANMTITTGKGDDTITMKATQLTATDVIDAGLGSDTLTLTGIANLTDAAFTGVSGVEKLSLGNGDGQKVVLGTEAAAAGILEIDATVGAGNSVTIDASASTLPLKITTDTGADTVILGAGVSTVDVAAGNDTIKTTSANLTSADNITGGAGTDTLVITDAANLTDSAFTNIATMEVVKLSDAASQTVELGAEAAAAGLTKLDASALTGTNSVTATLSADGMTFVGGAGADTIKLKEAQLEATTLITGGAGTDTIEALDAVTITDGDLAGMSGVEVIKLQDFDNQTVTLGTNASAAGINNVDASGLTGVNNITVDASAMTTGVTVTTKAGDDIITMGSGADTIDLGAGDDTINVASDNLNSADAIDGGANSTNGKDILKITTATSAIADSAFTDVSGIEKVVLTSNSAYTLTLGSEAGSAGFSEVEVTGTGGATIDASALTTGLKITGGTGSETVTLGANVANLALGAGDDIVKIGTADFTSADAIDGGAGTDTIEITDAATVIDTDFTLLSGVETIKLGNFNTQSVTLGDKAINAGVNKVDYSAMKNTAHSTTTDLSSMSTDTTMSVIGGYGADTIKMDANQLTSADTITGDLGTDILQLTTAASLADSAFTNITGVEKLVLGDFDAQTVALGNEAFNSGSGFTTVDATALTGTNTATVDMSSATSDVNVTVLGGAGVDTITMKSTHLTKNDTLDGNGGTADILKFTDAVSITDTTVFNGISDIETIELANTGAQTLTLKSNTFSKVDASAATGAITLDASAQTTVIDITTGTGADVITLGTGDNTVDASTGANTIKITGATLTSADHITAGNGTSDKLEVSGTTTIADGVLANVSGVETIKLTNAGAGVSVTLGANAVTGGVNELDASGTGGTNTLNVSAMGTAVSVKGGTGSDSITMGSGNNTIIAGDGADTITMVASTLNKDDTITGGNGTDTLVLTGAATIVDADVVGVTGIESIKVADATGQTLTLGANATTNNLIKVDTSAVTTSGNTVKVDLSGMSADKNFTYVGGAGDDTVVVNASGSGDLLTATDSLSGGTGSDTLQLGNKIDSSVTTIFNGVSGFETLKLADVDFAQKVTLKEGLFTTVDGSGNTYTKVMTVDAGSLTGNLTIKTAGGADVITATKGVNTIDAGSGDDTIKLVATTYTTADTITGGLGSDTLELSGKAVVTDALVVNTSVDKIKLTENVIGQSVTLGTNAIANQITSVDTTLVSQAMSVDVSAMTLNTTVKTGAGIDTIKMGSGNDTVEAGGGDDTITIASANYSGSDTIKGEAGNDTLVISDIASIIDSAFAGTTTMETIKLTDTNDTADAHSLVMGANAATSGIKTIDISAIDSNDTIALDISAMVADVTVKGGASNNTIKVSSANITSADKIDSGSGTDTLVFTNNLSTAPTALALSGISNIEKIELSDFNDQKLTLVDTMGTATNASLTVDATAATGVNKTTIDASALGTKTTSLTVNTSGGDDTITLGASANTVNAGAGVDTIKLTSAVLLDAKADTINGGAGNDILDITTGGVITDAKLAGITNVETMKLSLTSGVYDITLGTNARTNNLVSVDGSTLTTSLTVNTTDLGTADMTLKGGSGNNTFKIDSSKLTSADVIDGGAGSDTVIVNQSGATTLSDSSFTALSTLETLKYANDAAHTLTAGGEFKGSGITTVDASVLVNNTLSLDMSSMTTDMNILVKGGAGADTVKMAASQLTSSDDLQLGLGLNVLQLSGSDTLIDTDFKTTSTGITKLQYTENLAQTLTLGTQAQGIGIRTIDASSLTSATATISTSAMSANMSITTGGGDDVVTLGTGKDTVVVGSGDDTIKMVGTSLTLDDTITGGAGTDTLEIITTADNLVDADFTNVATVETLKLSVAGSAQTLTLGEEARGAGITTVDASALTASATLDVSTMTSDVNMTLKGGTGADTFIVKGTQFTKDDVITGGSGTDILQIVSSSTATTNVTDAQFEKVSEVETLKLTSYNNTVSYGNAMQSSGIKTIDGSANTNSGYKLSIDLSDMSDTNYTAISGYTLKGGAGDDTFKIKGTQLASTDTITAGTNATSAGDTLEFTTAINITDSTKFNGVTGIETIKLSDGNDQSLTLKAGLASVVDASALTTTNKVTIDATAMTTAMKITTAGGDDTIKLGSGVDTLDLAAGDDTVETLSARLESTDTMKFGAGSDTLKVTDAATVVDADFTNITGLEKVVLSTGINSVTLGDSAKTAGVRTIDASAATGVLTLNMSSMSSNADMNVTAGSADDLITLTALHLTKDDVIDGGTGNDTLTLTGNSYLVDEDFTGVKSIKTLTLGDANHDLTLGSIAQTAGIDTLNTTAITGTKILNVDISGMTTGLTVTTAGGADTITMSQGADTINTGAGSDTIIVSSENLTAGGDTINGGADTDVLSLTTAIDSSDKTIFTNVSNIESVKLSDFASQKITLKSGTVDGVDASTLTEGHEVIIDASDMNHATNDLNITLTSGAGNDTIIMGDTSTTKYTVTSGDGDDLIQVASMASLTAGTALAPADKVDGGAGNDTLEFTSTSAAQTITDANFLGTAAASPFVKNIETLKFSDKAGHSVTLGTNAMASGITTVDTSAVTSGTSTINFSAYTKNGSVIGGDSIEAVTAGKGVDTLTLGAGDDTVSITTAGWTSADTIDGGDGTDTITVSDSSIVADALFTNITSVEKLVLAGATSVGKDQTVTVGDLANTSGLGEINASTATKNVTIDASGITNDLTITTGTGADKITAGAGNNTITAGSGADTIKIAGSTFDENDTINGGTSGTDVDTLEFTDAISITDVQLGNITNIESIKIGNFANQSMQLGTTALAKGITKVDASFLTDTNQISVDISDMNAVNFNFTGGAGSDELIMKAAEFTLADTITGGAGNDTITLSTAATSTGVVVDADFTNVKTVETLKLSDFDAQSVTLAAKAMAAGINKVDATNLSGGNKVTVDATAFTNALAVDSGAGDDLVKTGTGITTLNLASGDDSVEIASATFSKSFIDGGVGTDKITLTDKSTLVDASFAGMMNIETLVLKDIAGNTLTLGSKAQGSGLSTVDASALTGTNTVTINAADITSDLTIKTGAAADTITLGAAVASVASGAGADTIKIKAVDLTSADSIFAGTETDTLEFLTASTGADKVVDADFTLINSLETLKFGNFASQEVVLGVKAKDAGVTKVDASTLTGTNSITVDYTALTGSLTVLTGAGNDIIIAGDATDTINTGAGIDTVQMASASLTSRDTIDGGLGIDILQITDAATVIDTDFTLIKGLETLKVGDFAAQTITLAAKSSVSGLTTIDATAIVTAANGITVNAKDAKMTALTIRTGAGDDVITAASSSTNAIYAASGDDTVKINSVGFTATDIIDGGTGTDTLEILDKAILIDTSFTNVSNIEKVKLNDFASQSVTLGTNATAKGITKVDATALLLNGVTVDVSAMSGANLDIQTGAKDDTITIKVADLNGSDIIKAGAGVDTLKIKDIATITDATFATAGTNLTGIEVLALSDGASQSVTLGANAKTLGITTLDATVVTKALTVDATNFANALTIKGGTAADTVTTATGDYNDVLTLGAGNDTAILDAGNDTINLGLGDDTVNISSTNLSATDVIIGDVGVDTLLVSGLGSAAITDAKLAGVKTVETLKLADNVASTVTLSTNAANAGIATVNASLAASLTLDASGFKNNLAITGSTGADTIFIGIGNNTVDGGAGDDTFKVSSSYFNSSDKLTGGTGSDTILVIDKATIGDTSFVGVTGVETLKIASNVAGQTITLGANAVKAGITTLDLSGIDGANFTVNTSAFTGALTIITDREGGKFITSSNADTIKITAGAFGSTSTINTGTGVDILNISTVAAVTDAMFGAVNNLETLKLDLGGTVTLGAKAVNAGLTTVDLSSASAATTLTATAFTKGLTTILGANNDSITTGTGADTIKTAVANLTSGDTINLGTGEDILEFTTAAGNATTAVAATVFTGVTGVETLKFGAFADQYVALTGTTFKKVDATAAVSAKVDISGETDQIGVTMGKGNDTVMMSQADFAKYSDSTATTFTLDGGAGTLDTLMITDAAPTFTDSYFNTTKIKGFELVGVSGGSVVLSTNAQKLGFVGANLVGTAATTVTLTSLTTGATVILGDQAATVKTGSGNDTLYTKSAQLTSADDIAMGAGTLDTIVVTDAASSFGSSAIWAKVINTEVVKLGAQGAGQTVDLRGSTLTKFDASTLTAASNVTVNLEDVADTIAVVGGAGNDTIKMLSADVATSMQIMNGGLGTDTLEITDTAALVDAKFSSAKLAGIEILKAAGSVVMGTLANATAITQVIASGALTLSSTMSKALTVTTSSAGDTITTGAGADTIIGDAGDDTIKTGAGNDTIKIAATDLTSADVIWGEVGADILEFTTTIGSSTDAQFTGVKTLETVKLGNFSGQTFTYGDLTKVAGVITVDGSVTTSGNGVTFDLSSLTAATVTTLKGGAGDDIFKIKSADLTSTDVITGGAGNNKLIISNAATITDAQFGAGKVTSIQTLQLSDAAAQSVTMGANATTAGIRTIDGSALTGTNAVTISLAGMTTNQAMTLKGGAAADTFKMKAADFTAADTLVGGAGTDILEFTTAATVSDAAFALTTGIETIKLGNFNVQTITLGALASTAGVVKVDGVAMTGTNKMTLDATAMSAATLTFIGGAGADTFKIKAADFAATDTITGGAGIDILTLTGGATLVDTAFTLVTGIETLTFAAGANYDVTLGATKAQVAGIVTVDGSLLGAANTMTLDANTYTAALTIKGGAGNDTIKSGSANDNIVAGSGDDTITSGAGTDTLDGGIGNDTFIFANANFAATDKIIGGTGTDILEISDAATITDAQFALVSGVETLKIDVSGTVTLAAKAQAAGIVKVDGSGATAAMTVNASGMTKAVTVKTGAGDDKITGTKFNDTFDAGAGADTFYYSKVAASNGKDVIDHFSATSKIALSGLSGTTNTALSTADFGNYVSDISVISSDTVITLTGGDTIKLLGVTSGITAADFFYA